MTSTHVQGVLDLTFLDIRDDSDMTNGITQRIENKESGSSSPSKKKEVVKAIRLSNNLLNAVDIIYSSISLNLDASKILWLDLSFNTISRVGDNLNNTFPNLTTIYLHANKITKLSEIKKLGQVVNLKSLSLYGNPVEEHKHYRNFVLYTCPKLMQFDMSPVTKSEIQRTEVWSQTFRKKLNPPEED